jgi:hypothetical protein
VTLNPVERRKPLFD